MGLPGLEGLLLSGNVISYCSVNELGVRCGGAAVGAV